MYKPAAPVPSKALLEVDNLKVSFPIRRGLLLRKVAEVRAVDGVSLVLQRGQTLGLVGESGCGKSTLGRTIIRLLEPSSGSIRFEGEDFLGCSGKVLREKRRRLQMIFQDPFAALDPRKTVGQIIMEPLQIHRIGNREQQRQKALELLVVVGLKTEHINRYPHEFSGGQRQRISIARSIMLRPELIIADEPTSALDVSVQAQILNLLKDLQRQFNLTYIFISHDLAVVEHVCDTIAVMYLGKIVEIAPRDALFAKPQHPYTQALLTAIPQVGRGKRRGRLTLGGDVPSPIDPPSGCAFHPRCQYASARCSLETPALESVIDSDGHQVACWLPAR
ncbi:MAG: oligopeptide transport system ATP-binding protein [Paraglaciecola psychrophila]|jgi:oligopeptide transport system ATP-binding protein